MKQLKDIIRLIDPLSHVALWVNDEDWADDEEPAFEGSAMDVPWIYLDFYLYKDEKKDVYPMMSAVTENKGDLLVINLVEKEKSTMEEECRSYF